MSNIYKYKYLVEANTKYGKKMMNLSKRIFVEAYNPVSQRSKRVIELFSNEPHYKQQEIINYYPRHPHIGRLMNHLRQYGLFRDEHEDFKEEMERLRVLRGKVKRTFNTPAKSKTLMDTKK